MRPFLIWRDDWLLGLEAMDDQHLRLADTLNDLHRFLACEDNRPLDGMDQLSQRLSQLMDMTRRHFQDEEVLMQANGYLKWDEHHREHTLLLAELQECIREIEEGKKSFTLETLKALKFWQIDHVLYSDRVFVDYLKSLSRPLRRVPCVAISGGPSIRSASRVCEK